jgi:SM-20-related protein
VTPKDNAMHTFRNDLAPRWVRHVSRRISIGDRQVLVLDGLFRHSSTNVLQRFLRAAPYRWAARDTPATAHSRRWTMSLPRQATRLPLFADIEALVGELAPSAHELVDAYVNFNVYGEVHYVHRDAAAGITALYCANLEWNTAWQGETFFYDGEEPAHVVAPRPGRLVLFDAALRHRGSPPSRDCWSPRIYLVLKYEPRRRRRGKRAAQ